MTRRDLKPRYARISWTGRRSANLAVVLVLAFACSSSETDTETSDGDGTGGPPGPADVAELCGVIGEAWCKHVEACGCGATATASCESMWATSCAEANWQALAEQVASGEVSYDPGAVGAALAALSDPAASCEDFYIDLGWSLRDLLTYRGILTGTVAEGSACAPVAGQKGASYACQPGLICHGDSESTAICKRAALEGEPCDVSGATSLCIDERPADRDNEFESAFEALVCIPDVSGASTGTCTRSVASGQPCEGNVACASNRCVLSDLGERSCQDKLTDGAPCDSGLDCSSGACDYGSGAGVCGPPFSDGEPCSYDDASCASGQCQMTTDPATGSSTGVCGAPIDRAAGEGCNEDFECASDVCQDGRCVERICRRFFEG